MDCAAVLLAARRAWRFRLVCLGAAVLGAAVLPAVRRGGFSVDAVRRDLVGWQVLCEGLQRLLDAGISPNCVFASTNVRDNPGSNIWGEQRRLMRRAMMANRNCACRQNSSGVESVKARALSTEQLAVTLAMEHSGLVCVKARTLSTEQIAQVAQWKEPSL